MNLLVNSLRLCTTYIIFLESCELASIDPVLLNNISTIDYVLQIISESALIDSRYLYEYVISPMTRLQFW